MERKYWIRQFFGGIICVAVVFVFAGCGDGAGKQQIRILDGQTETRLLIEEGTTVRQALAEAEIFIGKKDVVEPSRDSVITEDVTKILVERYTKVSVAAEGQKEEVALTGGKVGDALEEAKIKLEETDSVNHDLDAFLTDGMSIEVVHNDIGTDGVDRKEKEDDTLKGTDKGNGNGDSERTIVSKEKIYDCDGSGHGYYSITWSDGTVEYEDF